MEKPRDEDAGTAARAEDGLRARMSAAGAAQVAWRVVQAGVLIVTLVVALDLLGVLDVFDDEDLESSSSSRLPGEYLYLDDERVDAYLGQLQGGLSSTERRSTTSTKGKEAQLGSGPIVQVGGTTERTEVSERTLFTRAADRFFVLEGELESRFAHAQEVDLRFKEMEAAEDACVEIKRLVAIKEGQILRITGANLRVPTYALALAKVAHADQFRPPDQEPISQKRLARLALESQPGLRRFVKRLGPDPALPFRLKIMRKPRCEVFMPARYSKVIDAPALLTGPVTIVGKVVRRLTHKERIYFDVDTAVRYERALEQSGPGVRRTLGLDGIGVRKVVNASATIEYPGLVLLPLAIYK